MDRDVVQALEAVGMDLDVERSKLRIAIPVDEDNEPLPLADDVVVATNEHRTMVTLKRAEDLFVGHATPPVFSGRPPPAYLVHFWMIEHTASEFCGLGRQRVRDKEFEDIYNHLRRRPDGSHDHPIFSCLRAAARLLLSIRDVSRAEYESILRRLTKSAHTFAVGPTSTNYTDRALTKVP